MNFTKWLETLINEKELDRNQTFEFVAENGTWNLMPLGVVEEFMSQSMSRSEQAQAKTTLVKIDFLNGSVMHFFEYIAKGIAKYHG